MWTAAFSLVRQNWQAVAVAILLGVCYLRIAYIKHERDEAVANLTTTTNLIRDNALKAEAEKALLAAQGAKQRKADQEQAIQNAQVIGNAYYGMVKEAKNETKQVKINSVATADALRDQLREQSSIIASRGRAQDDALHTACSNGNATLPGRTEEESAGFYRAAFTGAVMDLRMCKLAGASCASDFNECRAYVLGEQSRIGVTDQK
jgi:hypothetical protein